MKSTDLVQSYQNKIDIFHRTITNNSFKICMEK